jgi:hypothetical protein
MVNNKPAPTALPSMNVSPNLFKYVNKKVRFCHNKSKTKKAEHKTLTTKIMKYLQSFAASDVEYIQVPAVYRGAIY